MARGAFALPLVGMALGTVSTVLGTNQLSHAWLAGDELTKNQKWKLGGVGAVFVGLGVTVTALSSFELGKAQEARELEEAEA